LFERLFVSKTEAVLPFSTLHNLLTLMMLKDLTLIFKIFKFDICKYEKK